MIIDFFLKECQKTINHKNAPGFFAAFVFLRPNIQYIYIYIIYIHTYYYQ